MNGRVCHSDAAQRRLTLAGLVALALLALGEAAPGAFPVWVTIEGRADQLTVSVDGAEHRLSSGLGGGWTELVFETPGPRQREYQIDGSDTTSTGDRDTRLLDALAQTPVYRFDSWLRDEGSYSRWEDIRLIDLSSGRGLAMIGSPLPAEFRIQAALRRPEAPARVWLVGRSAGQREGLELDRDRRNARWLIDSGAGAPEALPRWFFPEQPLPFVAELLQLVGRSALAGYGLLVVCLALGRAARRGPSPHPPPASMRADASRQASREASHAPAKRHAGITNTSQRWVLAGGLGVLAGWLLAAALVSVRAYQQLPHVLDALSYSFQAGLLSSGRLWLDAPVPIDAFRGPFEVLWQGRLFSQYPPGAPAAYALGRLANLDWLVGPLCGAVLIGATAWTAAVLFDAWTGLVVLWLGALSPFILFQAGSFLSHPVAGALVAGALAVFVAAERSKRVARYSFVGVCLGAAFLVREPASLLFGLPLVARLLKQRQWRGLQSMLLAGVPFLVVYLAYDAVVTGSPLQLPRTLFDPSDHFGFGDAVGFHHRHTLAAGLANTDELLTLLQFDLFGWPPLVGLGLLGLPFLLGRARSWDWVAGGGCLAFVAAYIGYFYHGIALGPRYYYEAVPWLLLLAGRGAGMVCELAGTRLAVMAVLLALSLHTLVFYLPAELERRIDFSGWPDGQRIRLGFVAPSPLGPRLTTVSSPTLVLTNDWWLFNAALSSLNCPRVPDCLVTFALAPTPADAERLQQLYPGRMLLHAVNHGGTVELEP